MQRCKMFEGYGPDSIERKINAWIAMGSRPYKGDGIPGVIRFIHDVSYHKDGVCDRALVIYEDLEVTE